MSRAKREPKDGAEQPEQISFEASIHQLSEIVERLEGGELPLEESIKLFEKGMGLANSSQKILDIAEKRVEELLGIDESGVPQTREQDDDE